MHSASRKSVVITGVSSGFGFYVTKKLLTKNYFIIAFIRGGDTRGREIFAQNLEQINNKQIIFIDAHLDKTESLNSAIILAQTYLQDGLDILINNAGYGLLGPVELLEEADIRQQFETNFFAPLFLTQKFLPALRKKQGRILNLSSLVGFTVFPFYGVYAASKHAIDCLTEALYYDLSEFNIQVCAITPGGYKTNFCPNAKTETLVHPEKSFYEKRLKRFKNFLGFVQEKIEKDPAEVVNTIVELCEKRKIPVRVQVGTEVYLNWFLKRISPDQWRIKFQDWLYKKFFF